MAKRSNKLSDIKNLTLSQVMSMSRADLQQVTRALVRESNKRLTVMEKRGISTPATKYIEKHGGRFSVGDKDIYQLREEFTRAKEFLDTKTSTIKGYREWETGMVKTLEGHGIDYGSLTEEKKRNFWKKYSKVEELDLANTLKGSANYKSTLNLAYQAVKEGIPHRGKNGRTYYRKVTKKDIDALANQINDELYAKSTKDFKGEQLF